MRNDPENFTDPTGGVANFVVWAAVNVAMWAAFEYVSAWQEDREFSYSAKDALADAVSWAAWVGVAQKAARLWRLAKPLFESVANASSNTLSAVIRSDCPKGRMTAGNIAGVFWSQLVSQITMRAQGAVVKWKLGLINKNALRPYSKREFKNWNPLIGNTKKVADSRIGSQPTKRWNAPLCKEGCPIEIHHTNQNPEGPFEEMTRIEHRIGDNYSKNHKNLGPSQIDRTQFNKWKREYWETQWDSGRFTSIK